MIKLQLLLLFLILIFTGLTSTIIIRNPGCNAYDQVGVCKSCSSSFYRDQNNICQPVNPNCKTYNQTTGACLSCYDGFGLIQDTCLPGLGTDTVLDPNCNQFQNNICIKCSFGYFFDLTGKCTKADSTCQTFNQLNGACTSCYTGFVLNGGKCIRQTPKAMDINCNQFDSNNICVKCSSGFYFKQGVCTKIEDSCRNFDIKMGLCTACYTGYVLDKNSQCIKEEAKPNPNPYCAQWKDTVCLRCAQGTIFDRFGICTLLDTNCKEYQTQTSICKACYDGYSLQNGSCIKSAVQSVTDPNCNTFENGICTKCSQGFYFNDKMVCAKIDDSCKAFNFITRKCMECYPGYQLDSFGQCIKFVEEVSDPNCAEWNGKICKKCSFGSSFNIFGVCVLLDSQCKEYDQITKLCKACYAGYELNNMNTCIKSAVKTVSDPLCAEWKNEICVKCSFRSFMNPNTKMCTLIDSSCKTSNQVTGTCLTCYDGYELSSLGTCTKVIEELSDVNCAEWKDKTCLRCSFGSAFNNFGKCTVLDAQCKEYDQITGFCKGCYTGYTLNSLRICQQEAPKTVSDPFCAEWKNQTCVKCSFGSFFGVNRKCVQADSSCKSINQVTGVCMSCYDGYQLNLGTCMKVVEEVSDVYCAQWNGKTCLKCSVGSSFNNLGKCILLDSQCRNYDLTKGECQTCYSGYELNILKVCVKSAIQDVRDPLCAEWNGNLCTKCSQGTFFNSQKICTQVDSLCSSFNKQTGECLGCYTGYELNSTKNCVKSAQASNADPLCAEWDTVNKFCIRCSVGSFFNNFGICQKVDSLCKTSNALNGACTTCFDGYKISGSKCVISQEAPRDALCKQFNGLTCVQCSFGAFFNSKGICQVSDSSCLTFNSLNGACLTCYSGYVLVQGKCEVDRANLLIDPYCAQFRNQSCVRCSDGYYFERDGKCTIVDPLCATYNPQNGRCLSCYTEFELKSGLCIVALAKPKDPNCASFDGDLCLACSKGFLFDDKGVCVLVNPLCKTYNQITGACLTCYNGYAISGITCAIDKSAQSSNCAEYVNNICVRCAARTFMNSKGQCEKVSEDCRTYNDFTGVCLSCYSGFLLNSGRCVKSELQGGCSEFDQNGKCTKCANGYYVNNIGICSLIDAQCAKFSMNTKNCEGCYAGYTLLEGRCEISKVNAQFEVKNCVAYNVENKCIQCFDRFYLTNNQCKEVSIFCKTHDIISGACTGCYSGFTLISGQCKK